MSRPLEGVRIAASYIAADVEAQIRDKVRVMGGEFHHQLTPHTDFLIAGKRWTDKYNYAVQHEITLIGQEAFFAAHARWVHGDDLNLRQFLAQRRLAPFENMLLTITNMDNGQRAGFQQFLEATGASYVTSLNQKVSVLVSPLDRGKKVDGARKWQIPVVAPKWMTDSGKIGAALDPRNYDPGNPRATMEPPMIFRRPRPDNPAVNHSVSDTSITSYTSAADLSTTSAADTSATSLADASTTSVTSTTSANTSATSTGSGELPRLTLKRKLAPSGLLAKRLPTSIGATFTKPPPALGGDSRTEPRTDRLLAGVNLSFVGFDQRQAGIIAHTVRSLGGAIEHERPDYIVVPSVKPAPTSAVNGARLITEWALERSLFYKQPQLDSGWSRPVFAQPCHGFAGLRICISGFTEMDQRHVTLLVQLLGGEFRETLTADRELLVAGSPRANKVPYAKKWGVPVVSPDWLWQCVEEEKVLPISEQHCLDELGFRPAPRRDNTAAPARSASAPTAAAKPSHRHLHVGRMVAQDHRSKPDPRLSRQASTHERPSTHDRHEQRSGLNGYPAHERYSSTDDRRLPTHLDDHPNQASGLTSGSVATPSTLDPPLTKAAANAVQAKPTSPTWTSERHSAEGDPEEYEEHAEVRYQDDDAAKQAEILLAMGERPPTPPPAEPKVPSMRSTIYSRLRRNRT